MRSLRHSFQRQRNRIAQKLQDPRLRRVTFHSLRHWKATTEYAKTKDLLHVRRLLGHRRLDNTEIYTHLVNFEAEEYHIRVASTLEEAVELAEAGFEKWDEFSDGRRIYRKRKWDHSGHFCPQLITIVTTLCTIPDRKRR